MARGSAQAEQSADILYGDIRPRGKAISAVYLPDDLLDTEWFEDFDQFSGTNRWVARSGDMTQLGIPLDSAQSHRLDPEKRMGGADLACFKLPT